MKGGRLGGGACGEPGVLHVLSQSLNDIVKDMIFHLCRSSDEAPLSGPAPHLSLWRRAARRAALTCGTEAV